METQKRKYHKYQPGYRKGNIELIEKVGKGQKWKYRCDCGFEGITQVSENPGCCPMCSRKNMGRRIHGESPGSEKNATRLYGIWLGMKTRCYNGNAEAYEHYGGRGITVCEEWLHDYLNFKEWAMANGYAENLTIDREDVNGNYEPSNCRWVEWEYQCNNKRNSRRYEYNGKLYSIKELAKMAGTSYGCMKRRLNVYGWSVEDAVAIESKPGNNQKTRGFDSGK